MNGAVRGLGVHALTQEAHVLHLLSHKSTGDADLLAANDDHLLAVQELLGDDGSQAAEHVVTRVHHHALGADS